MESITYIKSFASYEDAEAYLEQLLEEYKEKELIIEQASLNKIGGLWQVRFMASDGQYELFQNAAYGDGRSNLVGQAYRGQAVGGIY